MPSSFFFASSSSFFSRNKNQLKFHPGISLDYRRSDDEASWLGGATTTTCTYDAVAAAADGARNLNLHDALEFRFQEIRGGSIDAGRAPGSPVVLSLMCAATTPVTGCCPPFRRRLRRRRRRLRRWRRGR
jgi:hypothetical protein